ncbi:MAG: DegQ family serine endoprotease, partial [Nitrospirae bacterium]|nr:DegQ family serine endoprotease [Nitrospirota bacterium]
GLVKKEVKADVNVSTTQMIKRRSFRSTIPVGPILDEEMRGYFGDIPQGDIKTQSLGSGFIISKDGYIITNNHVVEKAEDIKVTLFDETEYTAKIIGKDPKTDIALIKIDAGRELPTVRLGDSDKLEVGDWVVAVGNPQGLSHTVTAGIVSAKGRVLGAGPYDDFIQTDASINFGNSGGPLFNTEGEVVGINTAMLSSAQGIGFAIPINMAKEILPFLKEKGEVTRGWLGVSVQRVTPEIAQNFKLPEKIGALVNDISKGSPAEKGGIKQGDVIIEFDGKKIKDIHELPRLVANTTIGKEVIVKVLREGKDIELKVTIAKLKEPEKLAEEVLDKLGLKIQTLTPEIANFLGMRDLGGVIVTQIEEGGTASRADIRRGDIIVEINRRYPIKNVEDFKRVLQGIKEGENVVFLIRRAEGYLYIALKYGQ